MPVVRALLRAARCRWTSSGPPAPAALSFDLGLVQDLDAVGTAIEAGVHLLPGVVPGTDADLPAAKATASRVQAWWRELGFPAEQLAAAVTLTPSCGLAGATPPYARDGDGRTSARRRSTCSRSEPGTGERPVRLSYPADTVRP